MGNRTCIQPLKEGNRPATNGKCNLLEYYSKSTLRSKSILFLLLLLIFYSSLNFLLSNISCIRDRFYVADLLTENVYDFCVGARDNSDAAVQYNVCYFLQKLPSSNLYVFVVLLCKADILERMVLTTNNYPSQKNTQNTIVR
jgi:hypothetical protein